MKTFAASEWICAPWEQKYGTNAELYEKDLELKGEVIKATLYITARGVYEAFIGEKRVGDFILAPGWTNYKARLQYQSYDVRELLCGGKTKISVDVGTGWFCGTISRNKATYPTAIIARLDIEYADGKSETVVTDKSWTVRKSPVLFSDIYNGENYDASFKSEALPAKLLDADKSILIPQEGEEIHEIERLLPVCEIITPKGERVIDFGQNMTGYVTFAIDAKKGERIVIEHGEVLDKDGNFYRDNLRAAGARLEYTCRDGYQEYTPHHTFMGFRYIRLTECPKDISYKCFNAIVLHSDMKRTGNFYCSDPKINKLYRNIVWGQRGNFLDVPTDCPQRDERLGWTGDAQVFVKTASYNYDIEKFFTKWLRDMKSDQLACGKIPHVIPDVLNPADKRDSGTAACGSAWADAVMVCPWQIYLSYANKSLLAEMKDAMIKYVNFIRSEGTNPYRWESGKVFGDWLAMESTDKDFISDAFYAYSTSILIKVLDVLGDDSSEYRELYRNIRSEFLKNHVVYNSQTECVLAIHFDLCEDKSAVAAMLAKRIVDNGNRLATGFVGTPYLLHALSDNGYAELAYTLLLQENFPSWLFSVNMGATTIWEHWDSLRPDGSFWSTEMNSFNHYAYGSVGDFLFGDVCGIKPLEKNPGYEEFAFAPVPDKRMTFANAEYMTRHGLIKAGWKRSESGFEYTLTVPHGTLAHVRIGNNGEESVVGEGEYKF